MPMSTELDPIDRYPFRDPHDDMEYTSLRREINLLSGRVDLMLRTLARIVAKIDPGFLDDEFDPNVRRRSDLLGDTVLQKLKAEALAQAEATNDPEQIARLRRYFRDVRL